MSDAIDKAVADMPNATRGGCVCPMCGHNYPHTHTPEEITIFRNGAKFERKSAVESGGERPAADDGSWDFGTPIDQLTPPQLVDVVRQLLNHIEGMRRAMVPPTWCGACQASRDPNCATCGQHSTKLRASGSQESGSTECKERSPLSPASKGIDHE